MKMRRTAATLLVALVASAGAWAQSITLSSTTSTEQSGLFAHLLPAFKQATGVDVKVVAVGTGQALDIARRGDATLASYGIKLGATEDNPRPSREIAEAEAVTTEATVATPQTFPESSFASLRYSRCTSKVWLTCSRLNASEISKCVGSATKPPRASSESGTRTSRAIVWARSRCSATG